MGQQALDADYVEHPRIRDETLEARTYQEVIAAQAVEENTLVVLPTGLGKTAVAVLLAAHRLEEHPGSKILMLAPTRPLVEQHRDTFEKMLEVDTGVYEVMTGDTRPAKREDLWKEVGAFFATPQVVENDIINDRLDLDEFSLVVFDEVHRATGDYPYIFVADRYLAERDDDRVLGLTASPGSSKAKIKGIADDLGITNFAVRTEDDPDVRPYVEETETNWIEVELTEHFDRVKRQLEEAQRTRLKKLKSLGLLDSISNVKKTDLLDLRSELGRRMKQEDDPKLYSGMSHVAACMKVQHALELLETQGVKPLYQFFEKLRKDASTKAAQKLLNDEDFQNAIAVTEWMYNNGKEHPKMTEVQDLLREKLTEGENAIVFTQYRDTVDLLHDKLDNVAHLDPVKFKGQKDDFTQKKQLDILERFRDGEYNVLVSTSVGEEGLDIPAVDYVIFYEPIPSEIRTIQRRGRTGRQEKGRIYVLMAKNTRDEGYYWSAKNKEKQMKQIMHELKDDIDEGPSKQATIDSIQSSGSDEGSSNAADTADQAESTADTAADTVAASTEQSDSENDDPDTAAGQQSLDGFAAEEDDDADIVVYADDRENTALKKLAKRDDVAARSTRLEIGDFLVSDRVVVERKTAEDFVSSLIDNRLFPQLQAMNDEFTHPVMVIEGEDLHRHRDVHPNAVRGALSSVALDYEVPILWADDVDETVEHLVALAKREQEDNDRTVAVRGERSPTTEAELQKFIIAGLPNVSDTLAERLLEEFGSVRSIFTASETALKNVDGIGEEKAARIKEIVDREYSGG